MTLFTTFDAVGGPALAALLVVLLAVEAVRPLRRRVRPRAERWRTNAAMVAMATATVRLAVLPAGLVVAHWTAAAHVGLLHLTALPPIVAVLVGLLLLDYTTWLWHRLNHRVPVLWRFHAVHHTDLDLDAATAFRFHVGELLWSVPYRALQVAVIGADLALLLVFEGLMDAATAFHHSNLRLPLSLERALNLVVVTPRMHGIHHSIVERETNANWAVIFSWWDRLHGTLRLDVAQHQVTTGLPAYRDAGELTLVTLLAMPFRRQRSTWRLPDGGRPERLAQGDPRWLAA